MFDSLSFDLFACVEQQAEADVADGHHIHRRFPLARLLGAPLVVLRDGQGLGRPPQLCHSLLLRQLHPQADRAWNARHREARGLEECCRRTQQPDQLG